MDYENEQRKMRFMQKFKILENGCWEWQCGKVYKPNGNYGMFYWGVIDGKEKSVVAHRAGWLLLRGPVPDGGILCHKCNYPTCVNPDHIYVGTHKTNAADRDAAGRTSRAEDRPTWKRTPELIAEMSRLLESGMKVKPMLDSLGVGWQLFFRVKKQDPEFLALVKRTKSARYSVPRPRKELN